MKSFGYENASLSIEIRVAVFERRPKQGKGESFEGRGKLFLPQKLEFLILYLKPIG